MPRPIERIAILGGGTAGWMAAAVLARALTRSGVAITVVESAEIGTIGVGEATIPPILDLLRFLDIDLTDFVRHTQSTYKLGIKFVDWLEPGHSYWHPFGTFGAPINRRPFFHYWHRVPGLNFNDFSLCAALGDENRFLYPGDQAPGIRYALHFDAVLVARYFRAYAERSGVTRLERTVATADQREDGFLDALVFTDGTKHPADLFIDCSGFRGTLIEQVLKAGYIDWTRYLPCDRAVAFPTALSGPIAPYTKSTARPAGWQWRIPLQHRVGNGYVYCSRHVDDQAAFEDLRQTLGETPEAEPRFLRFVTGRRKTFWSRNCVALGLASGFLEPLESTSIQLAVNGVMNLLERFPDKGFDPANIAAYNAELIEEIERIRDFIVLHYCTTQRNGSPFWTECRSMELPDSLAERMEIYRRTGRVRPRPGELFTDLSWFYIFRGMGVVPDSYDPLADLIPEERLRAILAELAGDTARAVRSAPPHDFYLKPAATATAP